MRHIGIDPGGVYTGVAVHNEHDFVFWTETQNPVEVWDVIATNDRAGPLVVILEDFIGGGRRDRYIKKTLLVLGYIQYRCQEAAIECVLVHPDRRLSNVVNVPEYVRGKDAIAAAAHVLSYLEARLACSQSKRKSSSAQRIACPAFPRRTSAAVHTVTTTG